MASQLIWPTIFRRRKEAYQRLFLDRENNPGPDASIVLADLKKFCYVDRSTLIVSPTTRMTDTHAMCVAEGRREVWNRLQAYLRLEDREVAELQEEPE